MGAENPSEPCEPPEWGSHCQNKCQSREYCDADQEDDSMDIPEVHLFSFDVESKVDVVKSYLTMLIIQICWFIVKCCGDGENRTHMHMRLHLFLRDVGNLCRRGFEYLYYKICRTHRYRVSVAEAIWTRVKHIKSYPGFITPEIIAPGMRMIRCRLG